MYNPTKNVIEKAIDKSTSYLLRDFSEIQQLQGSPRGVKHFVQKSKENITKIIAHYIQEFFPLEAENALIIPISSIENFENGIPYFTTVVSLNQVTVIHNPITNETFTHIEECGAYVNGIKMRIKEKKENIIATDYALNVSECNTRISGDILLDIMYLASNRISGICCLSTETAQLGRKFLDIAGAFIEEKNNYLIAANSLILKEKIKAVL